MITERERYLRDMVSDVYNRIKKDLSIPDWVNDAKVREIVQESLSEHFQEKEEEITTFYDRGKF